MVACGIAAIFALMADRNKTEQGKAARFTPLFWRGRDHFTDNGWRYRTYSVILSYVAIVSIIIPKLLILWGA